MTASPSPSHTSAGANGSHSVVTVAVCGALGRMGIEVVKAVLADPGLKLVGVVDVKGVGQPLASAIPAARDCELGVGHELDMLLADMQPDVCVDFTHPSTVLQNTLAMARAGVRPVVGTTGMSAGDLDKVRTALKEAGIGGIVAPNFAIGAILMMKFAQEASRYLDHAEIIELHHNQKADAPSGTAIKTAEMMAAARQQFGADNAPEKETYPGARGGAGPSDIQIHSVRLPGYVASQEVIFGGQGQTLKIRHDTIDRTSFMPGVVMACKRVMTVDGLVYGLENLLQ
ncbi:MAG: 4-hydroxy-tetrahydrodipicolinate reductase [Candidatus Melainabacteria bacterium]